MSAALKARATIASQGKLRDMLRALPIDQRAEVIVGVFQVIASEFAAMVLEHVKVAPEPKAKPKARRKPIRTVRRRR